MNFFDRHSILILTILFVLGDIFAVIIFNDLIRESDLYVFIGIIVLEFIIVYIFSFTSIIRPIHDLKKEIIFFLSGSKKGRQLNALSGNQEIGFIINFFNKSLEILKNFKEELKSGKVLKSEVELASELQKNTLNKKQEKTSLLDIIANTKSASEVGGDSYDIIKHNDNYYIYLGDVTGHGVASGFVMMMVNALVSAFSKVMISAADILVNTNSILKPRVKSNMLMTLLMLRWNETEKKIFLTGAGHENLIVYKKNENKTIKIKSGGVALGMTKDISKILKETQVEFEQGDIIVMYTDGITEARNSSKENGLMFGIDNLTEVIENSGIKTAQGVFNNITIHLSRWMGYNHKQFDDITLIVIHYKGDSIIENDVSAEIPKENITEWNWD